MAAKFREKLVLGKKGRGYTLLGVGVLMLFSIIALPLAHAQSTKRLKAGVVQITSQAEGEAPQVGTGIIVRLEKDAVYIATASHVIEGDPEPRITFWGHPTRSFPAKILGMDGGNPKGLAALVVRGERPVGVRALVLDHELKVAGGEAVTIIGFPQVVGIPWAVSEGNLTGMRGPDLVFSGAVDGGNSGGPLFLNGHVVGIVTQKEGAHGNAVPAMMARFVLENWVGSLPEVGASGGDVKMGRDGAPMILIPAGKFVMGSPEGEGDPDEHPQRTVYLNAFYMDQYEVTVQRYYNFMKATDRDEPDFWDKVDFFRDGNKPVVGISWHDAKAYCEWAGKRLPTEAEWEKAARGTEGWKYPWGDDPISPELANYDQAMSDQFYRDRIKPVGSYEDGKSPYGIDDMAGNVWEWVRDWYQADYYQEQVNRNPKGPVTGRRKVGRGGAWYSQPGDVRSAMRGSRGPKTTAEYNGTRCAKDAS